MGSGDVNNIAKRFIDFYGWKGTVYGQNVTDFLASFTMGNALFSRLPTKGICPYRPELNSYVWTQANGSDLVSVVLDSLQTPACYGSSSHLLELPAASTSSEHSEAANERSNSPAHVWGYGLLFVTLINLCAVLGIVFLPFMGRRVYKLLMTFMVSLAVGSLLATALLILLPESLQLNLIDEELNKENSSITADFQHHRLFRSAYTRRSTWENFLSRHPWYLWRCCTVSAGLYLFFIIERVLKELIKWKQPVAEGANAPDASAGQQPHGSCNRHGHSHDHLLAHRKREKFPSCSINLERVPTRSKEIRYSPPDLSKGQCGCVGEEDCACNRAAATGDTDAMLASTGQSTIAVTPSSNPAADLANFLTVKVDVDDVAVDGAKSSISQGCAGGGGGGGGGGSQRLASVQPVAWMILLGDALHNFIDGLSIGAAFTRSTLSGVSICLAVLCEELPHELGDFAILLSAGMSMPMALGCNFLSACTCYLGFALGVFLGETGATVWVFAIATGMFLYISLVDMMPEVAHSMEEPEAMQLGRCKIFVLQNVGLFMGFGAVLLLAIYGDNIKID